MTTSDHIREAETIELEGLKALHAAADAPLRSALGLDWREVGDAAVSIASALPDTAITVNRSIGLGWQRPPQRTEIEAIVALYRTAGIGRFFLQPDPTVPDDLMSGLCEAVGLARARAWQKFERGVVGNVPDFSTPFTIRPASPEDGPVFARIVCAGFDLGEEAEPWLALLPRAEGWHPYIAWEGERPAGCGALFVKGGVAYADFGATAPEFRCRGAQSANLAHRVRTALEKGCKRIHTCTGVAVLGDPQHSYANMLKCGFRETHVRQAWQPA
jgi:Acetyltransferase (GNAT) family